MKYIYILILVTLFSCTKRSSKCFCIAEVQGKARKVEKVCTSKKDKYTKEQFCKPTDEFIY